MLRSPAIQRALDARRATLAREAAMAGTPSGSNEIQEPSITPTGSSADALDGAVEFGGDVADGESTGVPQTAIRGGISNSIGMPYSQVSVTVILSSNSVLSSVKASN